MMRPDGFIQSTRDSNIAADFNRNTLDGDIVRFSKGSAPVGSIGSYGNGANTYVNSSGTVLSLRIGGGDILTLSGANLYPTSDSGVNLGLSNRHFGNLHLSGTANVDTKIVLNNLSSDYYGTSFQINNTNADFSGALLDMRATSGSINTANGRFLRFYSDNGSTERFHVKGSGEIYTASGILLGGTGSANKLDDYEEGTFTPVLEGDSTAGDFTYNHQAGWYTKVGNLVTASINIAAYVTSGGTAPVGSLLVKGFPFTANVESVGSFQCNDMANSYQTNVAQYTAIIQSSNAHVHYRGTKNDGSAHATMQAQSMSYLRSTISYTTSS
jgi:hypothetical protein